MKRDLLLAALLALVLLGWWTYSATDFPQRRPVAAVDAPASGASATSDAPQAAAGESTPDSTGISLDQPHGRGAAVDGMATEAEFLSFVADCKARMGRDPFYSRFVDNHPQCVPDDRLISRYDELHVLPYHPVVAENCFEHYSSDTDMTAAERCALRPRDTYSGASKAQLLEWADAGDAVAASLLVEFPTATPQERFDAALAAYRLSGKPAELVRYVEQYVTDGIVRVDRARLEDYVDREPSALAALNGYVLSRIAKNAGDRRAQPERWKTLFVEHARHLAPEEFDQQAAEQALEALVAAQLGAGGRDA